MYHDSTHDYFYWGINIPWWDVWVYLWIHSGHILKTKICDLAQGGLVRMPSWHHKAKLSVIPALFPSPVRNIMNFKCCIAD